MVLSASPTYAVFLQGPATTRNALRAGLIKLGLDPERADALLAAMPCALKTNLSLVEAERYKEQFRAAGGDVVVRVEKPAPVPAPSPSLELLDDPPPLELLEAPPPTRPKTPSPVAPAPAPAVATAAAPAPRPLPDLPEKPPAPPWQHENPWVVRGIALGVLGVVSLVGLRCASRYKVDDRTHDFSAEMEAELSPSLMSKGRGSHYAVRADLMDTIQRVADQVGVKVEVMDIIEVPIDVHETGALDGSGEKRCVASAPDQLTTMTMERRLEWATYVNSCAAPRWVVGFSAQITARWGLASDTQYVEHYAFVWNYQPE